MGKEQHKIHKKLMSVNITKCGFWIFVWCLLLKLAKHLFWILVSQLNERQSTNLQRSRGKATESCNGILNDARLYHRQKHYIKYMKG